MVPGCLPWSVGARLLVITGVEGLTLWPSRLG